MGFSFSDGLNLLTGGLFTGGGAISQAIDRIGEQGQGIIDTITGQDQQDALDEAAKLANAATDRATLENRRQFDLSRADLAPWLREGGRALSAQSRLLGLNGDSSGSLRELQSAPGYQFRRSQGQKQLEAGLASRGGFGSGKSFTAGQNYAQDYVSNEYGNRLNQLASVANTGQSTGNSLASLGSNYAQNQGNLYTNNANAQGAARISSANNKQNNLYNILSFGASLAGSDIRLKTDIKEIGVHSSGLPLYSWTYKQMPNNFPVEFKHMANWGGKSQGFMSIDVRELMPEAVYKVGEYDVVDYGMIGEKYAN
jgi:hypothetical protein